MVSQLDSSIHQCFCSVILDSKQPIYPMGVLFLKFPPPGNYGYYYLFYSFNSFSQWGPYFTYGGVVWVVSARCRLRCRWCVCRPKSARGLGGGWSQSVAELFGALWGLLPPLLLRPLELVLLLLLLLLQSPFPLGLLPISLRPIKNNHVPSGAGCGPAGLKASLEAAGRGLRVALIEPKAQLVTTLRRGRVKDLDHWNETGFQLEICFVGCLQTKLLAKQVGWGGSSHTTCFFCYFC